MKFSSPLILFLSILFFTQGEIAADSWQAERSRHFIIYHQGAPAHYLNRVSSKAEDYYRKITSKFGFRRFDFWLWDNRCEIFLYPDEASYQKTVGSTSWSRAHVDVVEKKIKTYVGQSEFFDVILPHEMAHIIFREFIGFEANIPLWLDEGVAMLAEADSPERLRYAKYIVSRGKQLSLEEISNIENYNSIDPYIFFSQSASLVDFLLNRYGRNRFIRFFRQIRDRNNWEAALMRAYPFNSLEEFESRWLDYLN